jgi:ATP-binding cassette subfamily G (WHITE) protein 2 (PDR)
MSFTGPAFFGNNDATANRSGSSAAPSHTRRRSSDHNEQRPSVSSIKRPGSAAGSDNGQSGRPRAGSRAKRRPSFRIEDAHAADLGESNTSRASEVPEVARIPSAGGEGSKAESSDDGLMEEEDARREEEVHDLARKLTKQSTYSHTETNPVEAGPDSKLNPNSPNFSAKAWAQSLVQLQQSEADRNPMRTAGVAFRNLNAYGFGASTDYQKTVGNIWLQIAGSIRRRFGAQERRIDILQHFDGIVNTGEMLVVLGPPGSGCSTFLKTISGETYGFNVDKNSYLNYQGEFEPEPATERLAVSWAYN